METLKNHWDALQTGLTKPRDESETGEHHKAKFSHELIAGAAAYEIAKAYQHHCAKNGKPQSHEEAQRLIAGFSGAILDRLFETKGLDWIDREKVEHQAKKHAFSAVNEGRLPTAD